jgi:hypothetical protein
MSVIPATQDVQRSGGLQFKANPGKKLACLTSYMGGVNRRLGQPWHKNMGPYVKITKAKSK